MDRAEGLKSRFQDELDHFKFQCTPRFSSLIASLHRNIHVPPDGSNLESLISIAEWRTREDAELRMAVRSNIRNLPAPNPSRSGLSRRRHEGISTSPFSGRRKTQTVGRIIDLLVKPHHGIDDQFILLKLYSGTSARLKPTLWKITSLAEGTRSPPPAWDNHRRDFGKKQLLYNTPIFQWHSRPVERQHVGRHTASGCRLFSSQTREASRAHQAIKPVLHSGNRSTCRYANRRRRRIFKSRRYSIYCA